MPRTQSATLRVSHTRTCANAGRSSLDSLDGCTCKPAYFTFHRDRSGRAVVGARIRDRKTADRALRALLVQIDEGRVGATRPKSVTFGEWASTYLERLEHDFARKGSTVRSYEATIAYARPILGAMDVREIGTEEVLRVVRAIRKAKATDATVSKHLRQLSAVLRAAVDDGYLDRNPISAKFRRDLKLKIGSGVEPYTDAELAELWSKMDELKYDDVYVAISKAAVTTGARIGELIALNWDDLKLGEKLLEITATWDERDGRVAPKDSEPRTINLIPAAVTVFENWTAARGVRPGADPIFPGPRSHGRLNAHYLRRLVAEAAEKAGLPSVGENGRPRKPLHSLRATYTRLMLERGAAPQFVQAQLGHSDLKLTTEEYGRWSSAALTAEADKITEFPA